LLGDDGGTLIVLHDTIASGMFPAQG